MDAGYKLYRADLSADSFVPYHTHDEDEVILVLDGRVKMIVEETEVVIDEGHLLYVEARAIHCAKSLDENPASLVLGFRAKAA